MDENISAVQAAQASNAATPKWSSCVCALHPKAPGVSVSDRYELENALLRIEQAARDWHDEHCGCKGEAGEIGDAIARLDARRDAIRARQKFERGGVA